MPILGEQQQATFDRLRLALDNSRITFDLLDRYYDGQQELEQLGLAIPANLVRFTVVVDWPRVVADARADRLDVKGFRLPGADTGDEELWDLWQANDLDESDLQARLDYQVFGRCFHCIGPNEKDPAHPLITVESPREIIVEHDPRTREVAAGLRLYALDQNSQPTRATLYEKDKTTYLRLEGSTWEIDDSIIGSEDDTPGVDNHGFGFVPVVPTYRARRTAIPAWQTIAPLQGTSAMTDVIKITDAAARNLTNAQIAQETHAVPQRGILGATKGDFVDKAGNQLPVWKAYFGSVWAIANANAKQFQFDPSDLRNFYTMTTMYARLASGVSGLPPNYFGLAADDAASADAIRSREARLVKACERDQVALGNAREKVMAIAIAIRDQNPDKVQELRGMECLWYDAATPTFASRVDAIVKMHTAVDVSGRPLLPARMAYEELGWSPQKINRAMAERSAEFLDPYLQAFDEKTKAALGEGPAPKE